MNLTSGMYVRPVNGSRTTDWMSLTSGMYVRPVNGSGNGAIVHRLREAGSQPACAPSSTALSGAQFCLAYHGWEVGLLLSQCTQEKTTCLMCDIAGIC